MRDWEIHEAINRKIEAFANKVADELDKHAGMTISREAEIALQRAAVAVREAGKSPTTLRREARAKEQA